MGQTWRGARTLVPCFSPFILSPAPYPHQYQLAVIHLSVGLQLSVFISWTRTGLWPVFTVMPLKIKLISKPFNRYGPESGKWKDLNVLRSLARFRSVQFSIFNIFRELIYPIYYRALYGDTTFKYTTRWATNNACRCMAAGNYKRNICLWVLLLRREFVSQATH